MPPELELEPMHREALRAFLVAAATPLGLWLGWQLQDSSSSIRIRVAELGDHARELVERARMSWHRRQVSDLIARVGEYAPGSSSSDVATETEEA